MGQVEGGWERVGQEVLIWDSAVIRSAQTAGTESFLSRAPSGTRAGARQLFVTVWRRDVSRFRSVQYVVFPDSGLCPLQQHTTQYPIQVISKHPVEDTFYGDLLGLPRAIFIILQTYTHRDIYYCK